MRTRLLWTIIVAVLALAVVTTACGYRTSISSTKGFIDHGKLCSRIEVLEFQDEQLREDLLLIFACNEKPD